MASCDIYSADLDGMWTISFDDICQEALGEAIPVLEGTMRSAAAASIIHDGESEMVNSIRGSKPKKVTSTDCWITNVGPRGYSTTKKYHAQRSGGRKSKQTYKVSNALKAIWKEYGIPGHQQAQPFMDKATNMARVRVEKIIEDSFNKRIEPYEL